MPTQPRMPAHASWSPCGSSSWRRFVSAIRAALVMALVLCAVMHGVPDETHAPVSVSAAPSVVATGGEPHEPHKHHEAEDCAADAIVRSTAQSTEDLPLAVLAVAVLVAVSVAMASPLVRFERRRRRRARTGRVALVRTSRWRI